MMAFLLRTVYIDWRAMRVNKASYDRACLLPSGGHHIDELEDLSILCQYFIPLTYIFTLIYANEKPKMFNASHLLSI